MKRSGIFILSLILGAFFVFANLNAKNVQEYKMDKAQCQKFIKLSRQAVENDNLALAKAYAQKAIQADSWNKFAWANYNDILKQFAENEDIPEYGTFVEESQESEGPSSSEGSEQLEGC